MLTAMCGRFRLSRRGKEVAEEFAIEEEVEWSPRYNIAPSDQIPTVLQDTSKPVRHAALMRWGMIPFWAKDPAIGFKTINGMSETAASKPAFREAMRTRRCLIPADAFYEWAKLSSKQKQPYSFGMADDSMFAFAGLWDRWKDAAGKQILSCTILTTKPNVLVAAAHDRMPAILRPDDFDLWLDPGITDPARIADLLKPYDAQLMKKYPVSTRVNSVKNDDPQCAQEIRLADAEPQPGLFIG
jgi:putative SOS response-associated peptidase YedK